MDGMSALRDRFPRCMSPRKDARAIRSGRSGRTADLEPEKVRRGDERVGVCFVRGGRVGEMVELGYEGRERGGQAAEGGHFGRGCGLAVGGVGYGLWW